MSYAAPTPAPYGQQAAGDPGTLDLPYYGIGFVDALKRGFSKYVRFDGRASRSEYWWWTLAAAGVPAVLYIIGAIIGVSTMDKTTGAMGAGGVIFYVIAGLLSLAMIIPSIAVGVRRLHDQNKSGLFYLLVLIPSVGGIIMLVLMCMPSDPQGAQYDRRN